MRCCSLFRHFADERQLWLKNTTNLWSRIFFGEVVQEKCLDVLHTEYERCRPRMSPDSTKLLESTILQLVQTYKDCSPKEVSKYRGPPSKEALLGLQRQNFPAVFTGLCENMNCLYNTHLLRRIFSLARSVSLDRAILSRHNGRRQGYRGNDTEWSGRQHCRRSIRAAIRMPDDNV